MKSMISPGTLATKNSWSSEQAPTSTVEHSPSMALRPARHIPPRKSMLTGKVTGHTGLNGQVILNAVAISPNPITSSLPSRAVTVGDDQQMGFYKGPRYRWTTTYKQHTSFVYDAAFSPDGKMIVTVGADKKINLFSGEDGTFLDALDAAQGHNGSIFSVGWDSSGSHIATASADRTVKLWDIATKSVVQYISL